MKSETDESVIIVYECLCAMWDGGTTRDAGW